MRILAPDVRHADQVRQHSGAHFALRRYDGSPLSRPGPGHRPPARSSCRLSQASLLAARGRWGEKAIANDDGATRKRVACDLGLHRPVHHGNVAMATAHTRSEALLGRSQHRLRLTAPMCFRTDHDSARRRDSKLQQNQGPVPMLAKCIQTGWSTGSHVDYVNA